MIIRPFRRGAGLVQLYYAVEDKPPTLSLEHDHLALGGIVQDAEPGLLLRASEAVTFFMCTTYNDAGRGVKTAAVDATEKRFWKRPSVVAATGRRLARSSLPSPRVSDGLAGRHGSDVVDISRFPFDLEVTRPEACAAGRNRNIPRAVYELRRAWHYPSSGNPTYGPVLELIRQALGSGELDASPVIAEKVEQHRPRRCGSALKRS